MAAASRLSAWGREGERFKVSVSNSGCSVDSFCMNLPQVHSYILVFAVNCCSRYVDVIEQAVVAGDTVLIENLEESIDPVIDPLLGRHTIKKGR